MSAVVKIMQEDCYDISLSTEEASLMEVLETFPQLTIIIAAAACEEMT